MTDASYKYFAFISYSSKDTEWGKRVQRKLEGYRMPAALCSEHGWNRTPIKPVFFAPTDIQPGGLSEELQERLKASRNLIVICSPNSARSEWVGKEIEYFHKLGRTKQIHFFIVDGQPHSGNPGTECFNPVINTLGLPEILGANIHEKVFRWSWMNKERAYVQLVSKLLDVEFDAIWQRHKRLLVQKIASWALGIVIVLSTMIGVWLANQPVDVLIRLNEASVHNKWLPSLENAVVTLSLDNESKQDTIRDFDMAVAFRNIPRRYIDEKVRISVTCEDFLPVDTTILLSKEVFVDIRRNPEVYGNIRLTLWNPNTEQTVPNAEVIIDGHRTVSDANGCVMLTIPLEEQKKCYPVSTVFELDNDTIWLPSGPSYVLSIKSD
jgi:hypothetical protein